MKQVHLLALCVVTVLAAGCFNTAAVKLTPEQVIWTPRTEWGRQARDHLMADFTQVVSEIQSSSDIGHKVSMRPEGLLIRIDREDTTLRFIALDLNYLVTFNTLRTNYNQRAASAYSAILFGLARILAAHPAFFKEPTISAFGVTLRWKATDFTQDEFRLMAQEEGMDAIIPNDILRDFATTKISIQELAKKSVFRSSLGRTELDFTNVP